MKIKRQVMVPQEEWRYACDICSRETPEEHLVPQSWFTLYPHTQYNGYISERERDRIEKIICDRCYKRVVKMFVGLTISPKPDEQHRK